ncbi:MAG: CotH kinase family protein [Candidatus Neomarinimicrobiota bacterium]
MKKLLILLLIVIPQLLFSGGIVINEVMSSNDITIFDEDGDASDWLELFNSDSVPINLEGYHLSDDSLNVDKWQFGNVIIEPGEHLIVFASNKDKFADYWHTNFKISASGEEIVLSDSSGAIIDKIFVPASESDISYGRISDGALPWIFQEPSPGSENTGKEIPIYSDSVTVSLPSGFYSSAVSVELTAGDSRIFYTLDGSNPDSGSTAYSAPISIQQTKVLKAISFKENHLPGPVICNTYFINENTLLPVISLSADPFDLFDADSGIYSNYTMDWERPAHVEFFEDDKRSGFSENCGIEIFGSQSATWAQKSMSIKFKEQYGVSGITYPLFPDFRITDFKAFVLRNSGNDWQYTHIRDAVMQTLVKDLDIDYLEYRPATTFINGEYWGIYNIREKINEHYIANRHPGVDPDNIDLLENNMDVIQGDAQSYQQLIDYMSTNDMSTEAAYAYLDSAIDLDECILYFAAQAYYDNMDWPGTNIKFWRERSASGKWRWILFGLDFGFGLYAHNASEDHITFMFSPVETRYSNPPWATLFQRKLIENPTIKNRFINQIADLLNTNFTSTRVVNVINTLANHISSDITRHRTKWNIYGENTDKMTTFAQQRPAYLRTHVRSYFGCGKDGTLTVNATEGGSVQLNTLTLQSADLPFSGIYFQGNAVHLKAIPAPGYVFDGWSGALTSDEYSVTFSVGNTSSITATFSPDTSLVKDIVINEINYNSADDFDSGDWIELYNRSDHSVDISGWYFSDSDDNHKFIFATGTVVEPDSYLVLVENDSAFFACFPNVENYVGETGFGLSSSGEYLRLVDNWEQIVDSLTYDNNSPWPVEADGSGVTLELFDAGSDNSKAENWRVSIGHGTPGMLNSILVSLEENKYRSVPLEFSVSQNYPNPFNPKTQICYSVPQNSNISLKVFNLLGQEVATLFEGVRPAGNYTAILDGSKLTSGVYFYRMESGNFMETKKLVLLK